MKNNEYSMASELLYKGDSVKGMDLKPESIPCFLTTAFTMDSLTEVNKTYEEKGYTYIRTRNPNRTALAEAISFLEGGEDSLIFSSGMGAITSTLMALLNSGDHVLCNSNIYGETFDVMTKLIVKTGVETELIDFSDLEAVKRAVRPTTKMIYSEVTSNPTLTLADISELSKIAHKNNAYMMVDNTFTTPIAVKPLLLGADIVINSLTKFLNGHSDAMGGSITASKEIIDIIMPIAMLCGTPGDPFSSWLILRGLHTAVLRIEKQLKTAELLAQALQNNHHVSKVNHPSLNDFPQKELAEKIFTKKGSSAMFSFMVAEDIEKIDEFMKALHFPHYAPTLGGIRTSLSHPVTSSHPHVPDDIRRKMGITPGLIRVSVGIEDAEDLINDFTQALEVFNK